MWCFVILPTGSEGQAGRLGNSSDFLSHRSVLLPEGGAGVFMMCRSGIHTAFGRALRPAKVKYASSRAEPYRAASVLRNMNYEAGCTEGLKPCSVLESLGESKRS